MAVWVNVCPRSERLFPPWMIPRLPCSPAQCNTPCGPWWGAGAEFLQQSSERSSCVVQLCQHTDLAWLSRHFRFPAAPLPAVNSQCQQTGRAAQSLPWQVWVEPGVSSTSGSFPFWALQSDLCLTEKRLEWL